MARSGRGAVAAMQVLSVYALASTIGVPAGSAYKATGRAAVLLVLSVPRLGLLIASLILFVDEGIVAVGACQAGGSALMSLVGIGLACRLLDVRPGAVWRAAAPSLSAGAALAAAPIGVHALIESPWPALLTGLAAGATVYLAALCLVAREDLRRLLALAFAGRASAS